MRAIDNEWTIIVCFKNVCACIGCIREKVEVTEEKISKRLAGESATSGPVTWHRIWSKNFQILRPDGMYPNQRGQDHVGRFWNILDSSLGK